MWKNRYRIMWTRLILHVSQRILRLPVTYERAAAFNYVLIWIRQHQLGKVVWDGGKGQVGTEAVFLFWVENLSSSAIGPKSGNFFNVSDCRVERVSSDVSAKPVLLCRKTVYSRKVYSCRYKGVPNCHCLWHATDILADSLPRLVH